MPENLPTPQDIGAALDAAIGSAVYGEVGDVHQAGLTKPSSADGQPPEPIADGRTGLVEDKPQWTHTDWTSDL
jgi:hypothetical protein